MDVIETDSYLFKDNLITLFDFFTYGEQGLLPVRKTEYSPSILYGRYEMIMDLIRRTLSFSDRSQTLRISSRCPTSKLVGII